MYHFLKNKIFCIFSIMTIIVFFSVCHAEVNKLTVYEISKLPEFAKKQVRGSSIIDMLYLPDKKINLAIAKLIIDQQTDSTLDIDFYLKKLDQLSIKIKSVPYYDDSKPGRLRSLLSFLYKAGKWNEGKYYQYDFSDPLGKKEGSRLLSRYIDTKQGNCVSMPILFMLLAHNLELDVNLVRAPGHFFARYRDGNLVFNVEATHGGEKRNESYINENRAFITDQSLKSGLYMADLTKKEVISVILSDYATELANPKLGDKYQSQLSSKYDPIFFKMSKDKLNKANNIAQLALHFDPKNTGAMLVKGNVLYIQLRSKLYKYRKKHQTSSFLPKNLKLEFDALVQESDEWYSKAKILGWRMPSRDSDAKYLKMVEKIRPSIDQY